MPKGKQKFVNIDNLEKEEIAVSFSAEYTEVPENRNFRRCEIPFIEDSTEAFPGNHLIFINGIHAAIAELNTGLGNDLIHSNHLKFRGGQFHNALAHITSRAVVTPILKYHNLI